MTLKIVNGELIQTPTVGNYKERRISSLGRRLVKNNGGHLESRGNYGNNNVTYRDNDGDYFEIRDPRFIKHL